MIDHTMFVCDVNVLRRVKSVWETLQIFIVLSDEHEPNIYGFNSLMDLISSLWMFCLLMSCVHCLLKGLSEQIEIDLPPDVAILLSVNINNERTKVECKLFISRIFEY